MAGDKETGGGREIVHIQEGDSAQITVIVPQETPGLRILAVIQPDAGEGVLKPVLGGLPLHNLVTGERIDPSNPEEIIIETLDSPHEPTES